MTSNHYTLNTRHKPLQTERHIGILNKEQNIPTTWILNRKLSNNELQKTINDLTIFCNSYHLNIQKIDSYHVQISGTCGNLSKALNIEFHQYSDNGNIYYGAINDVTLPIEWKDRIENILGLSTNKVAYPRSIKGEKIEMINKRIMNRATYYYPPQIAALYNFPTGDGTGQKVGIIELGGGYLLSDIKSYLTLLNITTTPKITDVLINGATNNPSDTSGANIEVVLDIEIIISIIPNADIYVYFAPNSAKGFYDAINRGINDGCKIISISWGAPEPWWSSSTLTAFNNLFQSATLQNINVFAASGDTGSSDGLSGNNVDFPASSQYIIGCGGTTIQTSGNTITSEVVWNNNSLTSATGGGLSAFFTKPSYQNSVVFNLNNKRGVPDVSGNANPNTGYIIYSSNDGGYYAVGGTSAVSPLWSALTGLLLQSSGTTIGFLNPILYSNTNVLRDITVGNNGGFTAGIGWDACTGNGSPNGMSILNLFTAPPINNPVASFSGNPTSGIAPLNVTFTDSSTNSPTNWLWNFGDSITSTLKNPTHIYNNGGIFTVSLTVSNTNGTNTMTKNNYINVQNPIIKPVVSFTATPTSGTIPVIVSFRDTSSNNPTSWLWNFGDGQTSRQRNPSHLYNSAGSFNVTLTATNSGGSNTLTKNGYIITYPRARPNTNFIGSVTSGTVPLTVQFTDLSTNNPTRWLWNFGDGTSSTLKNPVKTFTTRGSFTVTLRASNAYGSNTRIMTNYIRVI